MMVIEHEDDLTTGPIGFTRDGRTLYWISSIGRDKAALVGMDWPSAKQSVLAEHPKADISSVIANPRTHVVEAVGAQHLTLDWIPLDERIADDLKFLHGELPGEIGVADRTLDDDRWIVTASAAEAPGTYYLYERGPKKLTKLFASRPELKAYRLAPMRGEVIKARDGLELVSYLTLPAGSGLKLPAPLPLVLLVHGGPWARDDCGFDPQHQWLANRGYAVLSVNFRGSTGFGKKFLNAGDQEWGRKMHDDLLDAVDWAVKQGIADRDRVAIMGGSYGGYATLAGLTFTPEVFSCGVDIVGPSNLETLLATIPPYWAPFFENLTRRVGDPRTEEGRKLLQGALAAQFRRRHRQAAADRPGRQRPARQAGRVRPDRRGHAGQGPPGHLRALSRRGPRLRRAREPHLVLRHRRGLPRRAPGRPRRADRRRLRRCQARGRRGRAARGGAARRRWPRAPEAGSARECGGGA